MRSIAGQMMEDSSDLPVGDVQYCHASFHAFCIFNHVRAMGSFPTRSAAFSASLSLSAGRSLHYYYSRSTLHPVKIDW